VVHHNFSAAMPPRRVLHSQQRLHRLPRKFMVFFDLKRVTAETTPLGLVQLCEPRETEQKARRTALPRKDLILFPRHAVPRCLATLFYTSPVSFLRYHSLSFPRYSVPLSTISLAITFKRILSLALTFALLVFPLRSALSACIWYGSDRRVASLASVTL